jgi:hypothetical protein
MGFNSGLKGLNMPLYHNSGMTFCRVKDAMLRHFSRELARPISDAI